MTLPERLQAWQLVLAGGDDALAAAVDADAVGSAELHHQPRALDAEPRLGGAGLVVDAGVDDAAVVAGLVRGQRRLLLEDHEPCTGGARAERARGGERDDAAADDGQIVPVRHDAIDRARPRACQAPRVLRYHAGAGPTPEEAGMRRNFTKKGSGRREAKDGHPRSVHIIVEPAPAGAPLLAGGGAAVDA